MRHWLIKFFILCLIVVSFQVCSQLSLAKSLEHDLFAQTIQGSMSFKLTGASGVFRESKAAFYQLQTEQDVLITFTASHLNYDGFDKQATLDVTYWVNDNHQNYFSPEKSLVLRQDSGSSSYSLQGKVKIDAIESQPAGNYVGVICVTVSEPN